MPDTEMNSSQEAAEIERQMEEAETFPLCSGASSQGGHCECGFGPYDPRTGKLKPGRAPPDTELTASQEPDAHSPACKCVDCHSVMVDTRRGAFCTGCGVNLNAGEAHRWPCHPNSTLRPKEPGPDRCDGCGVRHFMAHRDDCPLLRKPKPPEPHPTGEGISLRRREVGFTAVGDKLYAFAELEDLIEFAKRYLGG